ncbi:hypothetical protein CKO28_01035 [Rhodovibrio sodomensis]|uniref:Uncharacterized protein n=1 Tax=Rhodovibrio sodomensis TaxID=1088 RepID=A0ABS1D894_9PROT|nr:hypothetical protein [Rhodovibrio sodomensis]MBK1666627.1 hypothetical protein [Rhodovibrio sodomensis]
MTRSQFRKMLRQARHVMVPAGIDADRSAFVRVPKSEVLRVMREDYADVEAFFADWEAGRAPGEHREPVLLVHGTPD